MAIIIYAHGLLQYGMDIDDLKKSSQTSGILMKPTLQTTVCRP